MSAAQPTAGARPVRLVRYAATTDAVADAVGWAVDVADGAAASYRATCAAPYHADPAPSLARLRRELAHLRALGAWVGEVGTALRVADAAPGGGVAGHGHAPRRPTPAPDGRDVLERADDVGTHAERAAEGLDLLRDLAPHRLVADLDRLRRWGRAVGDTLRWLGTRLGPLGSAVTLVDSWQRDTASPLGWRALRSIARVGVEALGSWAGGAALGAAGGAVGAHAGPYGAAIGAAVGVVAGDAAGGAAALGLADRTWLAPRPLPAAAHDPAAVQARVGRGRDTGRARPGTRTQRRRAAARAQPGASAPAAARSTGGS